jgi:hypothetical protein
MVNSIGFMVLLVLAVLIIFKDFMQFGKVIFSP